MSYSRWSNSAWYTYYMVNYSTRKEGQLFDVCGIRVFKYDELIEDIDFCVEYCMNYAKENYKKPPTDKQAEELKGYMQEFIEDVKSDKELIAIDKIRKAPVKDLTLMINLNNSARFKRCLALRFEGKEIPDEMDERY